MEPAVSIIVPVYNVEQYFERCIKSIINQTLENIEIILVDDGSPDNCPKLCDEFAQKDSRIKVIHKKNNGLGMARNSGIEIATGEFIAFLDSDDFVDINMYKYMYNFAKENNLNTVLCGFNRYLSDGTIVQKKEVLEITYFKNRKDINKFLISMIGLPPEYKKDFKYEMSVWRGIYSRRILKEYNILFPSEREFISEDVIFNIYYFKQANSMAIVPQCLYYYCENNVSLTKSYRRDRFEKNKVLYFKVMELLNDYKLDENFKINADRMLLARARVSIVQIVNNIDTIGLDLASKQIRNICDDTLLNRILIEYPIKKLPIKQCVFNFLLKYKQVKLLIIISKINNFMSNNR